MDEVVSRLKQVAAPLRTPEPSMKLTVTAMIEHRNAARQTLPMQALGVGYLPLPGASSCCGEGCCCSSSCCCSW